MQSLLLPEEVAQRLRLARDEVCALIHRGELRGILIPPDLLRVEPRDLRRFLRARTAPLLVRQLPVRDSG